jgi:hypothetical protein
MRNWTTKEIFILKRALRRGLRPEEIAKLLPRHSVRGIIARLPEFLRPRQPRPRTVENALARGEDPTNKR